MSGRKRVLIIDDDDDFVAAVTALLERAGYEVRRERDGDAGLQCARVFEPQLILLDVMMRERTEGFFVLQEIRRSASLRDTPVIVLSSIYADHRLFRVSPEAGWLPADQFLPKPIDPDELLTAAAHLMARPGRTTREPAGSEASR